MVLLYAAAPAVTPIRVNDVLTAEEWEALPEDARVEIVDGVLHPMAPPTIRHQSVKSELWRALSLLRPAGLRLVEEVEVRFTDRPVRARVPDIVGFKSEGFNWKTGKRLTPEQVVLMVEVVSPGSETVDRKHKPVEYAGAGIEHYWRVELDPELVLRTYRVQSNGDYQLTGTFKVGDTVDAPGLEWARVEVAELDA